MDTTARATQVADQPARVATSVRQSRRRRRPSGAPPPLPRHLETTGVGWLLAAVGLVAVFTISFAASRHGAAVAVTAADDRVVRWLSRASQRLARRRGGGGGVSRQLAGLQDPRLVHRRPAAGVQAHSPSGRLRRRPRGDLAADPGPVGRAQAAQAVRGRHRRELERLCAAVGPGRHPGRGPGQRPLCAGARGPLAAGRQVGGDRDRRPGGPGPGRARPRRPDRRAPRRRHRRHHPAAGLPLVHPQRGLPDQLPARPQRPPGRRRGPRAGHPPCPRRPARAGRRGGQAVRPGRLGRLHPAADQGQRRPADGPVRQAVRPQPPALGPLVQAGPRAALRPPGGREGVQHRRPAGPAGGLRPAAAARRRPAHAGALRGRRAHPRARVPVSPSSSSTTPRSSARPRSTRRSSTTASASSASCGTPGWPTATSSRPTCWSATAACC